MTQPRASQISLEDTPWYHVVTRCVRRAFLCGNDPATGTSYAHRRGWIEDRILSLASIFAIDIAAYAVMSNHYHVVLRVDASRPQTWTLEQTLKRWTQLFAGPITVQRYLSDERPKMSAAELAEVEELAETYRARLHDVSWFMRVLNESIARQANREDGVKGRFWEGRFKSQALLDDQALLAAMSYVDLNPVRAGIADTPAQSNHTSIARRIRNIAHTNTEKDRETAPPDPVHIQALPPAPAIPVPMGIGSREDHAGYNQPLHPESSLRTIPQAPLLPFITENSMEYGIPFSFEDYLELTQTLGQCVHPFKPGYIPTPPKLLVRLCMDPDQFMQHAGHLLNTFGPVIGTPETLAALARRRRCQRMRGIAISRQVFTKQAA
ncbi:hypothetical protein SAMN05421693_10450 [Ectothiorhodospira magna]|uniref:Transposase IS200-like domain-containing protein n=1 Tax=Ectothiorhodospira magna TaxID=867345 RepID=A0A1H9A524_9GAMM|nr:transposase [Ectothiorhodospira magna]SEP71744.1 hypothetical protein SAMN05421693_10450 [Ectothiorhodospira magna]